MPCHPMLVGRSIVVGAAVLLGSSCESKATDEQGKPELPPSTSVEAAPATSAEAGATPVTGPREATGAERELADAFVAFARDPGTATPPPFASTVKLVLGPRESATQTVVSTGDPNRWTIDLGEYRGFAGSVSPLELIGSVETVGVAVAPQYACTGTIPEFDPEYASMTNIVITGATGDSCFTSFRIDLFVNSEDEIAVVVVDLYDP